jgi:rubrerythrin
MDEQRFDELMVQAIENEVEARDFYREAATRVADRCVKETFEQLGRDEEEHRNTLETYRYDATAKVQFVSLPDDFKVAESEDEPPLSFDMSPPDALKLAMKKEQAAKEMYEKLAAACDDEGVRKVYENLARMELGHKQRLEGLFVDSAYPEVW